MAASAFTHAIVFHECYHCMVTKEKNDVFWPYCTKWCKEEANAEHEQTLWNYFYEGDTLHCEFCCCCFHPKDGSGEERFCSNQCAAHGAGMQKDEHTGVETLREQEKKPTGFETGKIYQEKIYDKESGYTIYLSRVIVQPNGTLKQIRGTVSLRKGAVFNSWLDWRSFCWPYIY